MLLTNIAVAFTQDADRTVRHNVDIRIEEGRIESIGEDLDGSPVHDCSGMVAVPGLINAHTHTGGMLVRGHRTGKRLFPWIRSHQELINTADDEVIAAAVTLAVSEALRTGTTTINDMWSPVATQACADAGIRAVSGPAIFEDMLGQVEASTATMLDSASSFIERFQDVDRIHPTVAPHAAYTCSEELLTEAFTLAEQYDVPYHIHLAESEREIETVKEKHGEPPVHLLDKLDVLDERTIAAHCVQLEEDDRALLRSSGASVAHCPQSNLSLGSGIAPVPSMDGISVGLGTDGAGSSGGYNLLGEAKTASFIQKRKDPLLMEPQRVLDMMTCEAADALGVGGSIGSLEEGKRADIMLIDRARSGLTPYHGEDGLLANLIYSFNGPVDRTVVDGTLMVDAGEPIGIDERERRRTVQEFIQSFAS